MIIIIFHVKIYVQYFDWDTYSLIIDTKINRHCSSIEQLVNLILTRVMKDQTHYYHFKDRYPSKIGWNLFKLGITEMRILSNRSLGFTDSIISPILRKQSNESYTRLVTNRLRDTQILVKFLKTTTMTTTTTNKISDTEVVTSKRKNNTETGSCRRWLPLLRRGDEIGSDKET